MLGSGVGGEACCGPFELADLTVASRQLKDGERERMDAAHQHFAEGCLKLLVVFLGKDPRKGRRDFVTRGAGNPAAEGVVGVPDGIALTEDDDSVGGLPDHGSEGGHSTSRAAGRGEPQGGDGVRGGRAWLNQRVWCGGGWRSFGGGAAWYGLGDCG